MKIINFVLEKIGDCIYWVSEYDGEIALVVIGFITGSIAHAVLVSCA